MYKSVSDLVNLTCVELTPQEKLQRNLCNIPHVKAFYKYTDLQNLDTFSTEKVSLTFKTFHPNNNTTFALHSKMNSQSMLHKRQLVIKACIALEIIDFP